MCKKKTFNCARAAQREHFLFPILLNETILLSPRIHLSNYNVKCTNNQLARSACHIHRVQYSMCVYALAYVVWSALHGVRFLNLKCIKHAINNKSLVFLLNIFYFLFTFVFPPPMPCHAHDTCDVHKRYTTLAPSPSRCAYFFRVLMLNIPIFITKCINNKSPTMQTLSRQAPRHDSTRDCCILSAHTHTLTHMNGEIKNACNFSALIFVTVFRIVSHRRHHTKYVAIVFFLAFFYYYYYYNGRHSTFLHTQTHTQKPLRFLFFKGFKETESETVEPERMEGDSEKYFRSHINCIRQSPNEMRNEFALILLCGLVGRHLNG